jgi:hypothetical protein
MAYSSPKSRSLCGSGRKKLDLNLRTYRQICDGKQGHADITDIDTKCFKAAGLGEYAHRSIEQLTPSPAPVLIEVAFEKHWRKGTEDRVARRRSRTKITKVHPHLTVEARASSPVLAGMITREGFWISFVILCDLRGYCFSNHAPRRTRRYTKEIEKRGNAGARVPSGGFISFHPK